MCVFKCSWGLSDIKRRYFFRNAFVIHLFVTLTVHCIKINKKLCNPPAKHLTLHISSGPKGVPKVHRSRYNGSHAMSTTTTCRYVCWPAALIRPDWNLNQLQYSSIHQLVAQEIIDTTCLEKGIYFWKEKTRPYNFCKLRWHIQQSCSVPSPVEFQSQVTFFHTRFTSVKTHRHLYTHTHKQCTHTLTLPLWGTGDEQSVHIQFEFRQEDDHILDEKHRSGRISTGCQVEVIPPGWGSVCPGLVPGSLGPVSLRWPGSVWDPGLGSPEDHVGGSVISSNFLTVSAQ
jgi:hypothetical protein